MSLDMVVAPSPEPASKIERWWHLPVQAARSIFFDRIHWPIQPSSAWAVLVAILASIGATILSQYLIFRWRMPLQFDWNPITQFWWIYYLLLWLAWLVAKNQTTLRLSTLTIYAALIWQDVAIRLLMTPVYFVVSWLHPEHFETSRSVWHVVQLLDGTWQAVAATCLLLRVVNLRVIKVAIMVCVLVHLGYYGLVPEYVRSLRSSYWDPKSEASQGSGPEPLELTQAMIETQSSALLSTLNAVQAQRPGVVDLYTITFAPYADAEVFSREATMVTEVMAKHFDAAGRQLQLQNNAKTATTLPWATPLNLQRAITKMAQQMNLDEDILFIHLTSHGARNGHLTATFDPLVVGDVTPEQLKTWLDEAGVRHRVISISACYAGSWISPLSTPGTLVMTASDAEHTSYGCGRKSELTFFGRAMYNEQLRQTHSFEKAHAVARGVIERREKEVGKEGGYSNPQIFVGEQIRTQLQLLEARFKDPEPTPPSRSP